MDAKVADFEVEEEARKDVVHRVAKGKAVVPTERRNDQSEKRVTEEITGRARSGEHFHSSLHPD